MIIWEWYDTIRYQIHFRQMCVCLAKSSLFDQMCKEVQRFRGSEVSMCFECVCRPVPTSEFWTFEGAETCSSWTFWSKRTQSWIPRIRSFNKTGYETFSPSKLEPELFISNLSILVIKISRFLWFQKTSTSFTVCVLAPSDLTYTYNKRFQRSSMSKKSDWFYFIHISF